MLANPKDGISEKTRLIQEDYVQVLKRDNGESKNITLIDKKGIHNNTLQVINQYTVSKDEGAAHDNRYDVTVLVNGLPLAHKVHGLIQAYSRTNRILNSIKTFGNIVCFRNLQKRTDDAISIFGMNGKIADLWGRKKILPMISCLKLS